MRMLYESPSASVWMLGSNHRLLASLSAQGTVNDFLDDDPSADGGDNDFLGAGYY